jgi:hypothetical protein
MAMFAGVRRERFVILMRLVRLGGEVREDHKNILT